MTSATPAFVPTFAEALPDIVISMTTDSQFTARFYHVFREVRDQYRFIEDKPIDNNLIRFIIPKDHPRSKEANLALYFAFIVTRDYPTEPYKNAWINKNKIFEQAKEYASDLTAEQSRLVVDELIKLLINDHYDFYSYYRLRENEMHYYFYCLHCHNYKSLLAKTSRLEDSVVKPALAKYRKSALSRLFHKNDIAYLDSLLVRIHQGYDSVSAQAEELSTVQTQIVAFRDSKYTGGFEFEAMETLFRKQHDLYWAIDSVLKPVKNEIYVFCDKHNIATN